MCAAAPARAASPPFALGDYVGNPNASSASAEAAYEANYSSFVRAVGARPGLNTAYIDYTQAVTAWPSNAGWTAWSEEQSPDAKNQAQVIGFPMASIASGSPTPDAQFQAFAAGTYDSEIQAVVQAWATEGFTTLRFRLGWEMNLQGGPTYAGATAQDASDWVAAFQHIHDVMKAAGKADGVTVTIIWNPGSTNYSPVSAVNSLYPGDAYVDIIGVDMYADMYPYSDGGSPATYYDWDTGQEDTSLAQFMADPINRAHYWSYPAADKWSLDGSGGHSQTFLSLVQFALLHNKIFDVPECGAGNSKGGHDVLDDPTFPQWLANQLTAVVTQGGRVGLAGVWDSNGGGNYEFSYPSDNKPQESAAWMTYFGSGQ